VSEELLREPADLLYANAPRTFLPAVLCARKLEVPVVCGLHLIFTGGIEHELVSWCFRQTQVRRAIFCSRAVAAPFEQSCGDKGLLVPYWVSPAFLEEPTRSAEARARLGLGAGELAVGVIGRISRTKGQRLFLEALSPLLPEFPALRLFVAGAADFEDPGEEERTRDLAAASPDPARVTVTGSMVESLSFLDAMDVLVVPSLWEEPFGLVAVEGMARRLPAVVTKSGGLQEIVEDGVTGFHVEKEPIALREAVRRLLEDAGLRARMGEAGRARVEDRFHPAKQMGRIMKACL
jgi:glycosyltransferase involved in cell wall biosynthesis